MAAMFSALYGNETLKADLQAALASHRLAHAYLVEGPPLCGKHTLCYAIAAALGGAEFSQKILAGNCPDVQVFGLPKDRKTISVELVRQIKESVYLKPVELQCKIYLLEQTECMTLQAQNALLKLLEEPPQNVYFFLLCDSATHLLPTVRSRAPALRLELFSEEKLSRLLLAREEKAAELQRKDPAAFARVLSQSEGRYGEAKRLLDQRKSRALASEAEKTETILSTLAKRDTVSIVTAISLLSSKREEVLEELQALQNATARLLRQKSLRNQMETELTALSKSAALSLYEAFSQAFAAIAANGNVTLHLTQLTYDARDALQGQKNRKA